MLRPVWKTLQRRPQTVHVGSRWVKLLETCCMLKLLCKHFCSSVHQPITLISPHFLQSTLSRTFLCALFNAKPNANIVLLYILYILANLFFCYRRLFCDVKIFCVPYTASFCLGSSIGEESVLGSNGVGFKSLSSHHAASLEATLRIYPM
jgi:hypothetical protein